MQTFKPGRRKELGAALVLMLAIALADVAFGVSAALVPLLVAGPLLAARRARATPTALIAVIAFALAIGVGAVEAQIGSTQVVVGALAVLVGGLLAIALAEARVRGHELADDAGRERDRAALLARVSELFEGSGELAVQLSELASLAVPDMAELCIVDVVGSDGRISSATVIAVDDAAAEALVRLRREFPVELDSDHPVARAISTGEPQLLSQMGDADLRVFATSPEHLRFMLQTRYRSAVVVPLIARGRRVGALTLLQLSDTRTYDERDLALVREFARRAGLAIEHARLFAELASTEAELQTVLDLMEDAVIVLDEERRVVYANRSAVHLFGGDSVDSLAAAGPTDLRLRWDLRDERGGPIEIDTVPWRRALRGEHPEAMVLRATERATGEVRFWQSRATPIPGAEHPRLAVSVLEDVTAAVRREFDQRFLAQATKLLTSSIELDVTLEKIAWASVPEMADWCAVDMPDERGQLRRLATADIDRERLHDQGYAVTETATAGDLPVGPPQVMRTGKPELYEDIDDDLLRLVARDHEQLALLRDVAPLSAAVVPIVAGDRVLGTITVGTTRESGRRLTTLDCTLMAEIGRRAGMALENARVHSERSSIAATLQDALLPPSLPVIPGLSIAARFRAAGEAAKVGGDFYDLFQVDGAWMVLIGDVTGKGAAAAAITSIARYTMRTAARYERSPAAVLERLNEALTTDMERPALCSAACARIEPGRDGVRLVVACAGHPLPLITGEGIGVRATGQPGSLLGAFEDGVWTDTEVTLAPGETVVLYTDGVTDTRGPDDRFGDERLGSLVCAVADKPADEIASRIDDALVSFQVGEQRDDVALMVMQAIDPAGSGTAGEYAEAA